MKFILLFILLSTNSYAKDWDHAYRNFGTNNNTTTNMKLTWEQADNILEACKNEANKRDVVLPTLKFEACSFWGIIDGSSWCHVITKKSLNLATLGHEIRHCFQGSWH